MAKQVQFLLEDIKTKNIVLPEFQREYKWKRDQTKDLLDSMLLGYPIGSFLIWETTNPPALKNLSRRKVNPPVKVLLDGQQRLTALYLLMRDNIPPYYNKIEKGRDPRNLYYNLKTKDLKYYMPQEMDANPSWVKLTDCFQDNINPEQLAKKESKESDKKFVDLFSKFNRNLDNIKNLKKTRLSVMKVDQHSSLEDALTVFDRVNTGGTPLSKADVALAYMCSNWKEARRQFKRKMKKMAEKGFNFDLKFMVRAMNAVINYRAEYEILHENNEGELKEGWKKLDSILDYFLNILKNRAYIYSTSDLNTPNVLIPIIGYLEHNGGKFKSSRELDKMLFWMYATLYKRRYSSSVDQKLQEDLKALGEKKPIGAAINLLESEEGDLKINKGELQERGVGHPFYNMMNFIIRNKGGVDWKNQLDLSNPFGSQYSVEKHHIFPKSVLKKAGYQTGQNREHYNKVHEIANRAPLTRAGNMEIFDKKPAKYLPEVEKKNRGNLEKFLIPNNPKLWKVENYELFLKKRRVLIAEGINDFMNNLIQEGEGDSSLKGLLKKKESNNLEFKEGLIGGNENYNLENAVAKTVAGMLNAEGGWLLIGVKDSGNPIGIKRDMENLGKNSIDGFELHLNEVLKSKLGESALSQISTKYEDINGKTICGINIEKSPDVIYMKVDNKKKFYVRTQNSTYEFQGDEADKYKNKRFN